MEMLKVFISFSGNQSKFVAFHLRTLIKRVCAAADPWTSSEDLQIGGISHYELMKQLQLSHFGIICLNRSNLKEPWIHFEAGAIAKTMDSSAVFPFLNGIEANDLSSPLSIFQSVRADESGTYKLLLALNKTLREKELPCQSDDDLFALFKAFWPEFEQSLIAAPKVPLDAGTERSDTEVLGELLSIARMHSRLLASVLRATPTYYPPIQQVQVSKNISINQDLSRLEFEELRREAMNLRNAGRYLDAITIFKRALTLEPNDVETQIDISVTETYLHNGGNYGHSIEKLTEIVEAQLSPQDLDEAPDSIIGKAYYNLACIKEIARIEKSADYSKEEILKNLEEAISRYPLYVNTASADQDLITLHNDPRFLELIDKYQKAQR